ncbi:alpha/beta hydrolase [Paenibacillus sp. GCM10012307]|uniref:Alpha/beta fold hydrolase n=1 Tax=Paenibacillus roseus TaxID=2798579 RepID=A0A934MVM0_9BACL|nr:alpha/beta fold hydrolase [Paenibacillus roseus]MBJ6362262.1 alpha/beta fold hydrolase [Paenibacillus roseus]
MERTITIKSGQWNLAATLHYPEATDNSHNRERYPIIVICHGFVGSRIGTDRLFVKAAREFSKHGFMVLRFDYAGCGESDGEYGETGLDSFIEQTRYVLDYALDMDCVDPERVILLGHSLGGASALLTAVNDKRVKTLLLWAPVAHPYTDIVKITGRDVHDKAMTQGEADYLGYNLRPVFFESLTKYQPLRDLKDFNGDVLLVHGTSDDVIPVDYTFLYQKLFWTRYDGQCDKEVILQGDHTFSSQASLTVLLNSTVNWLLELERKKRDWNGWVI